MKKLVKVEEIEGEGLLALLGQRVTLMCANYFYTGKLEGVNATCVLLSDAHMIYETGAWNEPKWKDAQKLPGSIYVQTHMIEAFGILK